jgi:hypothetical protein
MELGWFEDFTFEGVLGGPGQGFDFLLSSVLQYHFQHLADPGADGRFHNPPTAPSTDDVPYWTWGAILNDYTNNYFPSHPQSELDRYPSATYVHSTPGSKFYGDSLAYDLAPIRWDLKAGETWHFQFPTGNVMFYDPVATSSPANPQGAYVEAPGPLKLSSTKPTGLGFWDAAMLTWDVVGPTLTGGPPGSPGIDGTPGTADDQYALESWGTITLVDPPSSSGIGQGIVSGIALAAGEASHDDRLLAVRGDSMPVSAPVRASAPSRRLRD